MASHLLQKFVGGFRCTLFDALSHFDKNSVLEPGLFRLDPGCFELLSSDFPDPRTG
ncbi:hypothetical protein Dsin_004264 [Dipteronia sinensis]|uniref:Uncharacterized protein n=1 Tax=Dipteronia sinensis TaxID=43782 RepID=A0AAE0BAI6_9ROSI|nr:hypothetical protein Dsin_004264 [Dipteronia sinensis]